MIALVFAGLVAVLMASATYLLLQRNPVRMVIGLGLFTHAVNLLIFGTGVSERGLPPIIVDKAAFTGDISQFVDPLPQALILTAIVISFGIVAFMIALLHRRNSLEAIDESCTDRSDDPFAMEPAHTLEHVDEDYEWLEDVVLLNELNPPKRSRR
ncbi:MAG TPA: NADH-quinone oxidoreductase subunit K [Anaerolineales bacterium]|nr:NADH-quinone oxidoreductase subunit K [Anaerolineales bacterium]HRQ92050.1 NADH-quinone oxidoreductase subunit K [Anaerolineales bacterium]